jgi:hypothetical protein
MKKFEYLKTINSTIQELNGLGSIGWELVSTYISESHKVSNYSHYTHYIFKREINK